MLKMVGFDSLMKPKGPFYNSASKGKILIADMASPHIENALIGLMTKAFNEYVRQSIKDSGSQNLADAIENLDIAYFRNVNADIHNLVAELQKRYFKEQNGLGL